MTTITLATANAHKVHEIQTILADLPLEPAPADFPYPPEDAPDYAGNALIKARALQSAVGGYVLADDSGLEVAALGGRPGVHSSRYAPTEDARRHKLFGELAGKSDRRAAFVCAVAVVGPDLEEVFQGRCEGEVAQALRGEGGFGYDPLFYLPERGVTMAELPASEKNRISHRGRALEAARPLLEKIAKQDAP